MKLNRFGLMVESRARGGLERFVLDVADILRKAPGGVTIFYSGRPEFERELRNVFPEIRWVGVPLVSTQGLEDWFWMRRPPRWLWKSLLPFLDLARWVCLFLNFPCLVQTFGRYPVNVLHVVNGGYPGSTNCLAAVWAARKSGTPRIVVSVLGMPRRRVWPFFERLVDHWTAKIGVMASCCRACALGLKDFRGFPPENIEVFYHGVRPLPPPDPSRLQVLRSRWGLGCGPVVGGVSVLESYKGHRFLIEAIALLKPTFPGLRCLLVGDGKMRTVLERLVNQRGVSDQVILTGHVDEDPSDVIPLFDVFVHPTLEDALPYAVLDAMERARPIVATRVGGIPEQLEEGAAGLLVPPADAPALAAAIEQLLHNPVRASDLGARARDRVRRHFSQESMTAALFDVYGGIER